MAMIEEPKTLKCLKEKERRKKENDLLEQIKGILVQSYPSCSGSKMEKLDVLHYTKEFCAESTENFKQDAKEKELLLWNNAKSYLRYATAYQAYQQLVAEHQRIALQLNALKLAEVSQKPCSPSTAPSEEESFSSRDSAFSSPSSSFTFSLSPNDTPTSSRKRKLL